MLRANSGGDVGRFEDVTISFHSYAGSIPALTAGTANFGDLASGNVYGSGTVSSGFPDNTDIDFNLNAVALIDLNLSSGLIAIAGSQPVATNSAGVFGDTPASGVTLILDVKAVPEPSSAILLIAAAGIVTRRSRRKT
ncbi:PEP-CTERM sorting domain-containing protein [Rubripirellula tenax]|uniref:PEP-CTERM sorting domain-containing protein n=1 Tax=Rubripirellula tenax TaxID=2528015 RepID=UPI001C93C9DF|nr:PEP-CTERM sorting domain-containing protein [Rubripirellula tenax]